MNDQSQNPNPQQAQEQGGGAQESGAGYGNAMEAGGTAQPDRQAEQGGGMDSSGGTGSDGDMGNARNANDPADHKQVDQSVQRSETVEAEDIEFEADDDLIDDDNE